MNFLERTIGENTLGRWLLALGVFALTFFGLKLATWGIRRRLTARYERTKNEFVRLVADLARRTHLFFLLMVAIYAGSLVVRLPLAASPVIGTVVVLAFLIQVASWGGRVITYWVNRAVKRKLEEEGDAAAATTLNAVAFLGKIALWALVLLLALENVGIDVTALVTGLGIAGVAVALALQNILGDLFASISIVVDKPFLVGDFIVVGEFLGTVERIGLKTTRVRSLTGEQLVFSNAELLRQPIRNYKRMFQRRVMFSFGVLYETPCEKLAAIPRIVREIIEAQPNTQFDRAHFKEYGDFALKFEVVYYVLVPDYNVYMDIQQAINLELYRRFREEGIGFAYPTQMVYVQPAAPSVAAGKEGAHGR